MITRTIDVSEVVRRMNEAGKRVRICFELPCEAAADSRAGEAPASDAATAQAYPGAAPAG